MTICCVQVGIIVETVTLRAVCGKPPAGCLCRSVGSRGEGVGKVGRGQKSDGAGDDLSLARLGIGQEDERGGDG